MRLATTASAVARSNGPGDMTSAADISARRGRSRVLVNQSTDQRIARAERAANKIPADRAERETDPLGECAVSIAPAKIQEAFGRGTLGEGAEKDRGIGASRLYVERKRERDGAVRVESALMQDA